VVGGSERVWDSPMALVRCSFLSLIHLGESRGGVGER
jgi:hypothetical protein